MLTQFLEGLLHVQFGVFVAGVRGQQCEVLTLRCVAVHLHVDAHGRQRLLGFEHCREGGAVQQAYLQREEAEKNGREERKPAIEKY